MCVVPECVSTNISSPSYEKFQKYDTRLYFTDEVSISIFSPVNSCFTIENDSTLPISRRKEKIKIKIYDMQPRISKFLGSLMFEFSKIQH